MQTKSSKSSPKPELKAKLKAHLDTQDQGTKTKMLKASAELFAKKGIEGVSVRDISREAKINLCMVSYHFGGKEALYRHILEDFASRAQGRLDRVIPSDFESFKDPKEFYLAMRSLITQVVEAKTEDPYVDLLLSREALAGFPHSRDLFENHFKVILKNVIAFFKYGQSKNWISPKINCAVHVMTLFHGIDKYFLLKDELKHISKDFYELPKDQDLYVEYLYQVYIEGIKA